MSEEVKKERSVAEIQQEYTNLCARAGQLQYQILIASKDLSALNGTLQNLNLEAAAAQNKAAEVAAKSGEQANVQPS